MIRENMGGFRNALFLILTFCAVGFGWYNSSRISHAYQEVKGTVNYRSVAVRGDASKESDVVAGLVEGDEVTIIDEKKGEDGQLWYAIITKNSTKGYVRSDLIRKGKAISGSAGSSSSSSTLSSQLSGESINGSGGTIKGRSVRVRSTASTTGEMVFALKEGDVVTISDSVTGSDAKKWYKVLYTYNGTTKSGYIRSDLVTITSKPTVSTVEGSQGEKGKNGIIKGRGVRIRTFGSTSADVRCTLDSGTKIAVMGTSNDEDNQVWYEIAFVYGGSAQRGYVRGDLVSLGDEESSPPVKEEENPTSHQRLGAVKGTNVNVREEPVNGTFICKLSTGHTVKITEEKQGQDGNIWYYITFTYSNATYSGWMRSDFVVVEENATTPSNEEQEGEDTPLGKEGIVKGISVRVRESAVNGSVLCQVSTGHSVKIEGEMNGSDGYLWYQIILELNGEEKKGFIRSDYVNVKDTSLPEGDQDFETTLQEQGFPETYKNALRNLHSVYPGWKFKGVHTGLDWNDVVKAESAVGKNLVYYNSPASWKSTDEKAYNWTANAWYGFDGSTWVSASTEAVQFYLDPRNFLDDSGIFQFETLEYEDYHKEEGVSNLLAATFMRGNYTDTDGEERYYASTFMEAGKATSVNPYHLAARCYQEQGLNGSASSSGNVGGLEKIFNYYNIGAYPLGRQSAVVTGLIYASGTDENYLRPWNSRYRSIMGGAKYVGERYVKKGQNTLYFQKFNVVNKENGLYSHQYMTNLQAASAEAAKMKRAYSNLEGTDLVFRIPIYNNMPEVPASRPVSSANPNNYLASLSIENYEILPVFSGSVDSYYVTVDNSVSSVNIKGSPVAGTSTVSGLGTVQLKEGANTINIVCKAQNGETKTYTIMITRTRNE